MANLMDANLFENYFYAMNKEAVKNSTKTTSCPEDLNNGLSICAEKTVYFLDLNWLEVFTFNNLNELIQIKLVDKNKSSEAKPLISKLLMKEWVPVYCETDTAVLDIYESQSSPEASLTILENQFIDNAINEKQNLTILFLSDKFYKKTFNKKGISSYILAMDTAPENLVTLSLIITPDNLSINFNAPLLARKNALRYGTMIKR